MNQSRERYFEWTLLGLILIIGSILFFQALPFLNGTLGAITLYILLRRFNIFVIKHTSKQWSPWIITLLVTFFVMIPLSFAAWYVIDLVQRVDIDVTAVIEHFHKTIAFIEAKTGFDLFSEDAVAFATAKLTRIFNMMMSGINNFAINLFTTLLILFFLLSGGMKMEMYIARLLPFNDTNKGIIIGNISKIVRSNAIGIPLLATIQGVVSFIGYSLCGVNNALEFGVLTGFASMIPIVGTILVWVPVAIMQYFESGITGSLYVALYGVIVISQCDNVLRMIMQKRMANTHPLITIFGVIAGIPIFGFMGLVFGPLLVAMFLLFLDMFAREYILQDHIYTKKEPVKNIKSAPQPVSQEPKANIKSQKIEKKPLEVKEHKVDFKKAKALAKAEKRAAAKSRAQSEQLASIQQPRAVELPKVEKAPAKESLKQKSNRPRLDLSSEQKITTPKAKVEIKLVKEEKVTPKAPVFERKEAKKTETKSTNAQSMEKGTASEKPKGDKNTAANLGTEHKDNRQEAKEVVAKAKKKGNAVKNNPKAIKPKNRLSKEQLGKPHNLPKAQKRKIKEALWNNYGYERYQKPKQTSNERPIFTTVVSHGNIPEQKQRSTIKTQLVSMHTARGTLMADLPKKKLGKRRHYH